MKKVLLIISVFILCMSHVNAATCTLADNNGFCLDITKHTKINDSSSVYFGEDATKKPSNTYFKVSNNNEILYCSNVVLSTDHLTDELEPIDQDCREKPNIEKSIIYLYEYGYGKNLESGKYLYNSKYLYGNDIYKDYYITQTAVWYFYPPTDDPGDEWLFNPENDGVNWDTFWFNEGYDFSQGTYYGKTYDMVTKITALINDAKASSNASPVLEISSNSTTMNITEDGNYYISDAITLTGKYLTEEIILSVTGISGAFVVKDKNATSGITKLSDGTNPLVNETLYIKVPTTSITESEVNIKLSVSSKSTFNDDTDIIECNPGKRKYDQSMIKYNPNLVSISDELTLNINKHTVKVSKTDLNGNPLSGATLVIKQGEKEVDTWITTDNIKSVQLASGTYTLEEVEAPVGYELSDKKIEFKVNNNGKVTISEGLLIKKRDRT